MKVREVIRLLEADGWVLVSTEGSHRQFRLPGCVATGKTIETALRRIERAIEIHVRGCAKMAFRSRVRGTVR